MDPTQQELSFRIVMLALSLTFALIWFRNLLSIGVSRQIWYTPTEGLAVAIPTRLLMLASQISIVIYIIYPAWISWAAWPLPTWLRWIGVLPGAACVLLLAWIFHSLGKNFSTSLAIRTDQTLVTYGPYRWVRHPMYTAFVMLWVAFLLISANWLIGLTGLAGYALTMIVRTPMEEQMMVDKFSARYMEYMTHTGRFLPKLWG